MNDQRSRSEFTDVDHASKPEHYVQLLDVQQNMAFVQMCKWRARALLDLHPGLRVLDVGIGTGEDAREMAKRVAPTGEVVGLDLSQIMVDIARQRSIDTNLPVRFTQGDVQDLPFADTSFDRCYADKTFLHVPDPRLALVELLWVTRPGGLLVTVDGDQETQVLDTPYPDVTRRFFRFRNDGMQQPSIAHHMYALFKEFGIVDVQVEPLTRVTTDYESIQPVAHFIEGIGSAQQNGVVTAEEAGQWIAYLEEAMRTGRFFHSITWFITTGRKPM